MPNIHIHIHDVKPRPYLCWVRGKRGYTEKEIVATNRDDALFTFSVQNGLKMYECDAILKRTGSQ